MAGEPNPSASTRLNRRIERARAQYPRLWRALLRDWHAPQPAPAAWLTYAANYLFATGELRWALDPYALSTRLPGAPAPDFAADLAGLSLVVLTHAHNDHFDPHLIRGVRHLPLRWVIPAAMLETVQSAADLPAERICVPENGTPLRFEGLTLTPFEGLHIDGERGVPATGYLTEFEGRRWLFPGDTRVYDAARLPAFGRLDGLVAHLWLGRGEAARRKPTMLDAFCQFCAAFQAPRVVVTHLNELGRDADDLWSERHYHQAATRLAQLQPGVAVSMARMGEKIVF